MRCILEAEPRPWAQLHDRYHQKAKELAEAKGRARKTGPLDWYEELADKCKTLGKTSKEDILGVVVHFYVHDSKKGFDQFAVQRTFHAVFARVNGRECASYVYDACAERLFRV